MSSAGCSQAEDVLEIGWIGSFPNNLAVILHAAASEKPELLDEGRMDDRWMMNP